MTALKMSRFYPQKDTAQEIMMHSHIVEFPLFLKNPLYQKYSGIWKVSYFNFIFISSEKRHPLWSSFQENDPYTHFIRLSSLGARGLCPRLISFNRTQHTNLGHNCDPAYAVHDRLITPSNHLRVNRKNLLKDVSVLYMLSVSYSLKQFASDVQSALGLFSLSLVQLPPEACVFNNNDKIFILCPAVSIRFPVCFEVSQRAKRMSSSHWYNILFVACSRCFSNDRLLSEAALALQALSIVANTRTVRTTHWSVSAPNKRPSLTHPS